MIATNIFCYNFTNDKSIIFLSFADRSKELAKKFIREINFRAAESKKEKGMDLLHQICLFIRIKL